MFHAVDHWRQVVVPLRAAQMVLLRVQIKNATAAANLRGANGTVHVSRDLRCLVECFPLHLVVVLEVLYVPVIVIVVVLWLGVTQVEMVVLDVMMPIIVRLVILWLSMTQIKITLVVMLVLEVPLRLTFFEVVDHFSLEVHELLEAHLISM